MNTILEYMEKFINFILFLFGSLMVIFMFTQVISRGLFNYSFHWIEEFARLGMVWTTFLGAALLIKTRGHTKVDFFIDKLPKKTGVYANILVNIIVMVFVGILVYYSLPAIEQAMLQTTPGLKIPYGVTMYSILISSIFMIIFLIHDSVKWLKEKR